MKSKITDWCAVSIAALALGITIHHGYLMKKLHRISVRPALEIDLEIDKDATSSGLYLMNRGLGPARIERMTIAGFDKYNDVVKSLMDTFSTNRYGELCKNINLSKHIIGEALHAGGRFKIITLDDIDLLDPKERHKILNQLKSDLEKIEVDISYTGFHDYYHERKTWPPKNY